jgi:ATP-binding cassette subfamily B (MDR/TAP) protein 9|uniref:Bile salt export pump n=1 Tax=Eutreptiella gymnastica TaxID=73025 RepID=A0A7S4LBZ6_9EUGL|mmetsp:Transcript_67220/g.112571  ORF Transcript_67220/g.112571 Transcript_67220/m.112571 type:complete len:754 (+) Transcript_67220:46-2307(+)
MGNILSCESRTPAQGPVKVEIHSTKANSNVQHAQAAYTEGIFTGGSFAASLALAWLHPHAASALLAALNSGAVVYGTVKRGHKTHHVLIGSGSVLVYAAGTSLVFPPALRLGALGGLALAAPSVTAWVAVRPFLKEQFQSSGVFHVFSEPTVPLSEQLKHFRRIVGWAADDSLIWVGAYATLIAGAITSSAMPWAFTKLVETVTVPGTQMRKPILQLTAAVILGACISSVQSILFAEGATRMSVRVQKDVMSNVMKQETQFFESTQPGEILTQMGASASLVKVVQGLIPTAIRAVVSTATTVIILCQYDVRLAMICVVAVPFEVLSSYAYSQYFQKYNEKVQSINVKSGAIVTEMVTSVKTVRMFAAEKEQLARFWKSVDELIKLRRANNWVLAGSGLVDVLLPHLASMMMFLYASHLASVGRINAASLLTVSMYQGSLTSAFQKIMSIWVNWGSMLGQTRKVFELMDRLPDQIPRGSYVPEKPLEGGITFRNVTFAYASSPQPILRDFNLTVRPGELVAIVGHSGGGKSTCVNLILGLYDAQEGSVEIDGIPVHRFDPKYFYSKAVSVVSQEPILFSNSFTENITLGMTDVPQEKIEAAAQQAFAHDFIMKTKDGYDTQVGSRGERLSGGQRQRIAIARALIRDPSVLLLDEATSALDGESEAFVQSAIEELMKGRTVVVVAHRLSTIQRADRIIVLDKGVIVQEGTHAELVQTSGVYKEMVKRQLNSEDVEMLEATAGSPGHMGQSNADSG